MPLAQPDPCSLPPTAFHVCFLYTINFTTEGTCCFGDKTLTGRTMKISGARGTIESPGGGRNLQDLSKNSARSFSALEKFRLQFKTNFSLANSHPCSKLIARTCEGHMAAGTTRTDCFGSGRLNVIRVICGCRWRNGLQCRIGCDN